jgi:FkbM family methyltransferase
MMPYKRQIGRLLKFILPKNLVVHIPQGELRGTKWVIRSGNIEYALGSYEYEERKLFEKVVDSGSIVYDIGAHVGFYTLLASKLVGESGKVVAFEPSPRNLVYLKKHLEINHHTNVIVIEAAVSDKAGTCLFSEGPNNSSGCISEDGALVVKVVCVDELVMNESLPPPDYVKIDVEGIEYRVLNGMKNVLVNYSPKIFLATHSLEIKADCCCLLESLGYTIERMSNDPLDIFASRSKPA